MSETAVVDVFAYEDYRKLLGDYYVKKKELQPHFSYRAFSRRTGFRAPNHLQRVVSGERNLSPDAAIRFAKAMSLDAEEQAYFCLLVEREQTSDEDAKRQLSERLLAAKRYRGARRLDGAYSAYHAHWYIPAIFEMVACAGFEADADWISRHMRPIISREEAGQALDVLRELRLVEEQGGKLVQVDPVLTTGAEARRRAIAEYHRVMLDSAKQSIQLIPSEERDISALTLCVSSSGLSRLKQRIQEFRKELLAMTAEGEEGEQVVQLNMQLFPLTERCRTKR